MNMVFLNGILQPANRFKVEAIFSEATITCKGELTEEEQEARLDVVVEYFDYSDNGWRVRRYSDSDNENSYWDGYSDASGRTYYRTTLKVVEDDDE